MEKDGICKELRSIQNLLESAQSYNDRLALDYAINALVKLQENLRNEK